MGSSNDSRGFFALLAKVLDEIATIVLVILGFLLLAVLFDKSRNGTLGQHLPSTTAAPSSPSAAPPSVESMLRRGRWEKRTGFSAGLSWEFIDGGCVRIYDTGGEIDESFRWEPISRNENSRKIRIKYWRPSREDGEHREWAFTFAPDGLSAEVTNFVYKRGQLADSSTSTMYNP